MTTPPLGTAVSREVRAEMARQRVTQERLADLVGLSAGQVSRRLSGRIPLTLQDLDLFAAALSLPPVELVRRAREGEAA